MLALINISWCGGYNRCCSCTIKSNLGLLLKGKPEFTEGLRGYAVAANPTENNEGYSVYHDTKWPKHKHPTPYDIFGISKEQGCNNRGIDKRLLKKKYHEFAKLYHPDISQNIRIIRSPLEQERLGKDVLSLDEKVLRFKILTQAYEILTDAQKKSLYDLTKSNWAYGPDSRTTYSPKSTYANTHGYRTDSSYEYWNAGTWEEMNNYNNSSTKEKIDPWTIFLWFAGLVICLEATALLTRIENSLTSQQYTHEETEYDLTQSYMNYGLASDKFSRLRRFLWFRTYGLYRTKDDLDREAKRNEGLVQDLMKMSAEKSEKSSTTAKKSSVVKNKT